ncbi:SAM-dependent methyltransferase [Clostridiales Family XIII bacterium PM5-7]
MQQIAQRLKQIFTEGQLITMVFSHKRKKSLEYSKVTMRPVELSGSVQIQAEYTFPQKVTHRNLSIDDAEALALELVSDKFKQINIFTTVEDIQILAAKPEKPHMTTTLPTKGVPTLSHNKKKQYIIPDGVPCDFLIRLGVMDATGKVAQRHYSKFRQINRYLEIIEDVFPYLPQQESLKIIDFGCGKAYLTFALYYYLHILKQRQVEIIGLDLKKDVIAFCQGIAQDLGYTQLRFLMGDIADYTDDHADMVVTLHACDTATDYALINAVNWNAKVILSVPCCQHELFSQIQDELHQPMLKHGILKDRLTEYLTDGLRGLKLESKGYEVAMIEFTTLEHTAKNIMIKAIKLDSPRSSKAKKAQSQYEALRDFYHVKPTIEQL